MIYVGEFNEEQLINGEDIEAIAKAKERTGLKYIKHKRVSRKGVKYMKVWLVSSYEQTY